MAKGEAVDLSSGKCPDCGSNSFHPGPRGGAAIQVKCAQCGSCFNYRGPLQSQRIAQSGASYSSHAGPLDAASAALAFYNALAVLQNECAAYSRQIELAFSMLATCGVPRERAGSVHSGISVLVERMQREINATRDSGERMRRTLLEIAAHADCPTAIRLLAYEAAGLAK